MTKLNFSIGMLLLGTALLAGSFTACSSKDNNVTGTAGTTGSSGTTGSGGTTGTAGTTGAAGMCTASGATKADCSCVPGAFKHSGVCGCQDDSPDVCPTVGCVDKKLDVTNCGACGMVCGASSVCANGACSAAPAVVVPAITGCSGLSLVINGGALFYADQAHNTINKVGTATAIVTGEMGPVWLASVGTNLYWYNTGTKTIRKAPAAGGTATTLYTNTMPIVGDASAPPSIAGFLVTPDGATLYVSIGFNVISVPTTNAAATPTIVAKEDHGYPAFLALKGTTNLVYPATSTGDVDAPLLATLPAICGMEDSAGNDIMTTCPRLARSQGGLFPNFMAVLPDGKAYWVDGANVHSEPIGAVGVPFESVATAGDTITAITASTDTIYFADKTGNISKMPAMPNTTNASPTLLARAQMAPIGMAVDATKVYWATKDCVIASVAK